MKLVRVDSASKRSTKSTDAAKEEEEKTEKWQKRLKMREGFARQDWRWEGRPAFHDMTVAATRNVDNLHHIHSRDAQIIEEMENALSSWNYYAGVHESERPIKSSPITPDEPIKLQPKFGIIEFEGASEECGYNEREAALALASQVKVSDCLSIKQKLRQDRLARAASLPAIKSHASVGMETIDERKRSSPRYYEPATPNRHADSGRKSGPSTPTIAFSESSGATILEKATEISMTLPPSLRKGLGSPVSRSKSNFIASTVISTPEPLCVQPELGIISDKPVFTPSSPPPIDCFGSINQQAAQDIPFDVGSTNQHVAQDHSIKIGSTNEQAAQDHSVEFADSNQKESICRLGPVQGPIKVDWVRKYNNLRLQRRNNLRNISSSANNPLEKSESADGKSIDSTFQGAQDTQVISPVRASKIGWVADSNDRNHEPNHDELFSTVNVHSADNFPITVENRDQDELSTEIFDENPINSITPGAEKMFLNIEDKRLPPNRDKSGQTKDSSQRTQTFLDSSFLADLPELPGSKTNRLSWEKAKHQHQRALRKHLEQVEKEKEKTDMLMSSSAQCREDIIESALISLALQKATPRRVRSARTPEVSENHVPSAKHEIVRNNITRPNSRLLSPSDNYGDSVFEATKSTAVEVASSRECPRDRYGFRDSIDCPSSIARREETYILSDKEIVEPQGFADRIAAKTLARSKFSDSLSSKKAPDTTRTAEQSKKKKAKREQSKLSAVGLASEDDSEWFQRVMTERLQRRLGSKWQGISSKKLSQDELVSAADCNDDAKSGICANDALGASDSNQDSTMDAVEKCRLESESDESLFVSDSDSDGSDSPVFSPSRNSQEFDRFLDAEKSPENSIAPSTTIFALNENSLPASLQLQSPSVVDLKSEEVCEEIGFFDAATSTSMKGRHKINEARLFVSSSLQMRRDDLMTGVTILCGIRRPGSAAASQPSIGQDPKNLSLEPIAVLFDRSVFDETQAAQWWAENKSRIMSSFNV